jgi:hypothetical protein
MMIANGGTATFTQTGGSLAITDANGIRLGEQGGSTGVASITGGTVDVPNLHIGGNPFGAAGRGQMTIGGTASVDVAGTLHVYNTGPFTGFGDLTLAGGTLAVDVIDMHDGPNRFNWTGGTLNVRAGGTTTFGTPAPGVTSPGYLGAFQMIGPTQHLITGSAAQVAATDLQGVQLEAGSATETVEVQLNGGSIDAFGTFIVRNNSTFRQSSGTVHSLLTGVSSETDKPSLIVQTGGTHTADVTPIAALAPSFRAMFIGIRGTDTSTYALAGGTLNAIGGIAMGADLNPADQSTFIAGGTGILNISGGVATVTNGGILVLNTGRPNRINLSGGRLNTDSIDLQGDFSALNWTGGTFAYTGAGPFDIGSGGRIGMMLNMTPSKTLEVPNALRATAGGAIVLAGGHVKAASLDLAGDASRLQWSGGTLEITGAGGITIGSGATGPGTTMKIPAGANLDTTQLIVGPTGSLFVPGGNILARAEVNNGGDIRLGGAGARIDTSLPLSTNFLNFKLLRGDGQIDLRLQNQATGEVRATGDETLRFTSFSNTNSGKINLINGGTIDFTIGLVNNSTGQISGRGTLMVGEDGLSNAGAITMTGGR